jgi:hypothetical protein
MLASSLSATTVIGCALDSVNPTCYTTGMFSFADSLDWGAAVNLAGTGQSGFGTAFSTVGNPAGNPHDVSILPWNARSVGNVNIYASLAPGFTGTPNLTRADNTYYGYALRDTTFGRIPQYVLMDDITTPEHLITFAGHFNANPTNFDVTQVGEHLLGNISGNGSLLLSFDRNISQIGFRIAPNSTSSNTDFFATIKAYNGTTLLHTYTINIAGGGGICDGLKPANPNEGHPPVPCNDAAFIAMDAGPQRFTSIQVFTTSNINNGFFINGLQFTADEVPEPGMTFLFAGGLAGLWLFSRARRRFAGIR